MSLAYLALTFANLDRVSLGDEVVGVLAPRGKTEPTVPGEQGPPLLVGRGAAPLAPIRRRDHRDRRLRLRPGPAAIARPRRGVRLAARPPPGDRAGSRPRPRGRPCAALAKFYGSAQAAEDRYRLVVTVNDQEVYKADVVGADRGQGDPRPAAVRQGGGQEPREVRHRGPRPVRLRRDADRASPATSAPTRTARTSRSASTAASTGRTRPSLDGTPLAQGFGVAVEPADVREHRHAGRARRQGARSASRPTATSPRGQPSWERDFLVLKEYLPAGTTLVEGSVRSQAGHYTVEDGVLTAYFTPDQNLGSSTTSTATCPASTAPCRRASPAPTSRAAATWAARATSRCSPPARSRPTRTSPPPTSCTPAARPSSTRAAWPRPRPHLKSPLGRLRRSATTSPRTPPGCC